LNLGNFGKKGGGGLDKRKSKNKMGGGGKNSRSFQVE